MVHDDTFIVPDPPQEPIHPAAMPKPPAPIATDVDMPRHAVDTCQKTAESLECMIGMRMATARTEAYTLTEHYLRLARGVTEQ
ncbi:hypothetical protein GmHk_U059626 [Glycine max]|nr:hypothetical protein GmHk_U059626 [Glycine max]